MSDDVDDLLRSTMASLDRQVPAGYFDSLADRTLARLDDPAIDEPARTAATSAAGTLPPDGDELARERALRRGVPPALATATAPAATDPTTQPAVAAAQANRRRRVAVAVVLGAGVAAAAAVMIVISVGDRRAEAPAMAVSRARHDEAVAKEPPGAAVIAADSPAAAVNLGSSDPPAQAPENRRVEPERVSKRPPGKPSVAVGKTASKGGSKLADDDLASNPAGARKPASPAGLAVKPALGKGSKASGAQGEKAGKTKLAASLSQRDFQRGMDAAAARARACFAGTPGTATLRLGVAPSGRVISVVVSGVFAGTPVASCVERAVSSAIFPPWDGQPQSFDHRFLLSE